MRPAASGGCEGAMLLDYPPVYFDAMNGERKEDDEHVVVDSAQ